MRDDWASGSGQCDVEVKSLSGGWIHCVEHRGATGGRSVEDAWAGSVEDAWARSVEDAWAGGKCPFILAISSFVAKSRIPRTNPSPTSHSF
jgi:hypothetical protein